jgi:hypothetical protein
MVTSLGYADELTSLNAFSQQLAEYRALEEAILPLAVENTNLKAQRLSFGPLEQRMTALETTAQEALDDLKGQLGASAGPPLAAAAGALERFKSVNREIVALSRRNSEVRSLALSLGRKRMVTAVADDHLRALEAALAKHEFTATR